MNLYIDCEIPTADLGNFVGKMFYASADWQDTQMCGLSSSNLLLAGCVVKKTKLVIGSCIHAGQETKLSLNSIIKRSKFSKIEKTLNVYFFVYFFLSIGFILL